MDKHELLAVVSAIAVAFFSLGVIAFALLYRSVRRDVEEALKNANSEEQAKIRKQLVRAIFPSKHSR